MIEEVKKALELYTAYELAKVAGVSPQSLQKYKNGEADIENMRLGTAIKIVEYINKKEKTDMINELRSKYLETKDFDAAKAYFSALFEEIKEAEENEAIINALSDWYYEPNNDYLYQVESGMEYSGDDREAFEVFQSEEGKIINWR